MSMSISPISHDKFKQHFGYSHPLKTMYLKGKLPTVKHGIYGEILSKSNVTLEHLVPVSLGGKTELNNLALAAKYKNNERGIEDLFRHTNMDKVILYLDQFKNVITSDFIGNKYIKELALTIEKIRRGVL